MEYEINHGPSDRHIDTLRRFTGGSDLSGYLKIISGSGQFLKPESFIAGDKNIINVTCPTEKGAEFIKYREFAEKASPDDRLDLVTSVVHFIDYLIKNGVPFGWLGAGHIRVDSSNTAHIIYLEPFIDSDGDMSFQAQEASVRELIVSILEGHIRGTKKKQDGAAPPPISHFLTEIRKNIPVRSIIEMIAGYDKDKIDVVYAVIPKFEEYLHVTSEGIDETYAALKKARMYFRRKSQNCREAFAVPAKKENGRGVCPVSSFNFDRYDVAFFPSISLGEYISPEAALVFACDIIKSSAGKNRRVYLAVIHCDDYTGDSAFRWVQFALHRISEGEFTVVYSHSGKGPGTNINRSLAGNVEFID